MSDQQKISEYIDNLTFRKSLCMGFHPDEVYEAICNLTSMYNTVLSDAYDEADRLRDENEFLRRNADRLMLQTDSPAVTDEEEKKRATEMVNGMNSALWGSGEPADAAFDRDLADLLSGIKQPEYKEEAPVQEEAPVLVSASEEIAEMPAIEEKIAEAPAAEEIVIPDTEIAEEIAPVSEPSPEKKTAPSRSALNDRQIQRLKRGELLEILIESSRENEKLRGQVDSLNTEIEGLNGKLSDRSIKIDKAGNLAEAALALNGVFDVAQAAAQQYLDNLQALCEREEENCVRKEKQVQALVDRLLADTNEKCAAMTKAAEDECAAINSRTLERCGAMERLSQERCRQLENETKQKCDMLVAEAELQAQQKWDALTAKLEAFYDAHKGLRELLATTGYISRG